MRSEKFYEEAITKVHDDAWRYAYDGVIPAKELSRIIARRGPRWWDRAIRRGTAILVIEVGGAICGYATFGPNRARNLVLAIERPAGDEWSADLRDAEGHGLYSATGVTRHAAARDLALFLEQEE